MKTHGVGAFSRSPCTKPDMTNDVIDSTYLPFTSEQLRPHFLVDADGQVAYFERSAHTSVVKKSAPAIGPQWARRNACHDAGKTRLASWEMRTVSHPASGACAVTAGHFRDTRQQNGVATTDDY